MGSAAHRALARQAVAKSQVLLKNAGNVLPLATTGNKIFVAGKSADNIGNQSGGWTISWQGVVGQHHPGHDDPAGHPQHRRRRRRTVTYSADGSGIDSTYNVRDRRGRRDARTPRAGRPARRDGPGHAPT